jgi:hypothetical protein
MFVLAFVPGWFADPRLACSRFSFLIAMLAPTGGKLEGSPVLWRWRPYRLDGPSNLVPHARSSISRACAVTWHRCVINDCRDPHAMHGSPRRRVLLLDGHSRLQATSDAWAILFSRTAVRHRHDPCSLDRWAIAGSLRRVVAPICHSRQWLSHRVSPSKVRRKPFTVKRRRVRCEDQTPSVVHRRFAK